MTAERSQRSLLGRLLRVRCGKDRESLEDFLTEALAGVLLQDQGFGRRWLSELLELDAGEIKDVATQRTFRTVDEAVQIRRPDLRITTSTGLALVEAKVDALETKDQLQTYWDYLESVQDREWKALIFLTPNARRGSAAIADGRARRYRTTSWCALARAITSEDLPWTCDFQLMLEELHMADQPVPLVSAAQRLTGMPPLLRALDDALDGPAWRDLEASDRVSTPRLVRDGLTDHNYYGYSGKHAERSVYVSIGVQLSKTTPDDVPIPDDSAYPLARVDLEAWGDDREWLASKLSTLGSEWRSHPEPCDATLVREFVAYSWVPLSTLVTADEVLQRGEGLPWFAHRVAEVLRVLD